MDKHIRRRTLLSMARDQRPALLDVDTAVMHPSMTMAAIPRLEIAEALAGLAEHGYLRNMRPGRTPLYRITAAGLDQIHQEADLDEYVWGEHASQFQE